MRELEVLSSGHLKLDFANWKEFFEESLGEQVRSQVKRLLEQALEAERDRYLELGYYEQDPEFCFDYRNGYYFREFTTRLGLLHRLRIPRTRLKFRRINTYTKTGGYFSTGTLALQPPVFLAPFPSFTFCASFASLALLASWPPTRIECCLSPMSRSPKELS